MPLDEQIESIKRKLSLARKKDDAYQVFGAKKHRYRVRPVKAERLHRFEENFGVTLPRDFRLFLEHVGTGAGPFYGVEEPDWGAGILVSNPADSLRTESPLYRSMTEEEWMRLPLMAEEIFDDHRYEQARSETYAGVLPFGDQGCANYSCLVLRGQEQGRVVYLSEDEMQPFFVFEENFLDWYERWLDEILTGQLLQPYSGWFGATRGGSEERLLADFEAFEEEEEKLQCLVGLMTKLSVAGDTLERVWEIQRGSQGEVRNRALLLLLKLDYSRAEPVLRKELLREHPLLLFQNLFWYGKQHAHRWEQEIEELLSSSALDPELFRFLTYLIPHCKTNLKPRLKPWMEHQDKQIRTTASYAFNKEQPTLLRRARDWFPWLP